MRFKGIFLLRVLFVLVTTGRKALLLLSSFRATLSEPSMYVLLRLIGKTINQLLLLLRFTAELFSLISNRK